MPPVLRTRSVLAAVLLAALTVAFGAAAPAARADECPSYIQYKNGNYLKSGSSFYYPSGSYLKSGTYLYYSNGNYLKSGSYLYYPNGNYLKSGSYLYYPNGNYLRSGSYYYYDNGSYMKSGTSFYYKNGSYARAGTTLYRPDGSVTQFPVAVKEPIGTYGHVSFKIRATGETETFDLPKLINEPLVRGRVSKWPSGLGATIRLGTGYEGEYVYLRVGENGNTTCELDFAP